MKTKFKYLSVLAVSLLLGFGSCSSDDADAPQAEDSAKRSVTLRISRPSTYAEEVTAVGLTPELNDAKVYFTNGINILLVETLNVTQAATTTGQTFNDVPGNINEAVIIANGVSYPTDAAESSISVNDLVTELDALAFQQSLQAPNGDAKKVNLFGRKSVTSTSDGNLEAKIDLRPAISRIEIGKVRAKTSGEGSAQPLTSFDLTGIYINNTYTKLGTDYTTVPTADADIINYGNKPDGTPAAIWTDGSYPIRFGDNITGKTGTNTYQPAPISSAVAFWSYYVLPVKATAGGTTINGSAQSALPWIVIKIENAADGMGSSFVSPSYVTIKALKLKKDGSTITQLEPGKVYTIEEIAVDGEYLAPQPGSSPVDITVYVTVRDWEETAVQPVY